jgi:hypothetical protein
MHDALEAVVEGEGEEEIASLVSLIGTEKAADWKEEEGGGEDDSCVHWLENKENWLYAKLGNDRSKTTLTSKPKKLHNTMRANLAAGIDRI